MASIKTKIDKGDLQDKFIESRRTAIRTGRPRRAHRDLLVCLSKVKGRTWSRHGDFVVQEMERCLWDRKPDGSRYLCGFYLCPRCGVGNRRDLATKYTKTVKKMIDEVGIDHVHTITITGPITDEGYVVEKLERFRKTIQWILEQELPNCRGWGEYELAPKLREVKYYTFDDFLAEDLSNPVSSDDLDLDGLDQGSPEVASPMDVMREKYGVKPKPFKVTSKQDPWFDVKRFQLGYVRDRNCLAPDLTTDFMIHLHAVIMHGEITKAQVEAVFRKHFPRHKAILIEPFTLDTGGEPQINGWLRYMSDKSGGCKGKRRFLVDDRNREVALPGQVQAQLIDAYARVSKAADTTARKSRKELRFEFRTKKWKPVKRPKRKRTGLPTNNTGTAADVTMRVGGQVPPWRSGSPCRDRAPRTIARSQTDQCEHWRRRPS